MCGSSREYLSIPHVFCVVFVILFSSIPIRFASRPLSLFPSIPLRNLSDLENLQSTKKVNNNTVRSMIRVHAWKK